jgi:hypothetical protein
MTLTPRPIASLQPSASVILRHNEFYGRRREQLQVAGFSLAHLRADPAVRVQRHSHETGQ